MNQAANPGSPPLHVASLSKEAYRVVRLRILQGEFKLGQLVSRRRIAHELGMSFLPVSEALLRLEAEGLLESRPRAGTRVRIPSREDLEGHYVVREALEVQAARMFAERATPDEKREILELGRQVDAAAGGDHVQYMTLHEKLHHRIADLARSPALAAEIERCHAVASAWMCVGQGAKQGRHQEFARRLVAGDPSVAAEVMREHVREKRMVATERLEPYFHLRQGSYSRGTKPPVA